MPTGDNVPAELNVPFSWTASNFLQSNKPLFRDGPSEKLVGKTSHLGIFRQYLFHDVFENGILCAIFEFQAFI